MAIKVHYTDALGQNYAADFVSFFNGFERVYIKNNGVTLWLCVQDVTAFEIDGVMFSQPTEFGENLPNGIIQRYKSWKAEHPDEDYQYDEIHEFITGLSRGELCEVFESLLKLSA